MILNSKDSGCVSIQPPVAFFFTCGRTAFDAPRVKPPIRRHLVGLSLWDIKGVFFKTQSQRPLRSWQVEGQGAESILVWFGFLGLSMFVIIFCGKFMNTFFMLRRQHVIRRWLQIPNSWMSSGLSNPGSAAWNILKHLRPSCVKLQVESSEKHNFLLTGNWGRHNEPRRERMEEMRLKNTGN